LSDEFKERRVDTDRSKKNEEVRRALRYIKELQF
jgi:hypothetical protein